MVSYLSIAAFDLFVSTLCRVSRAIHACWSAVSSAALAIFRTAVFLLNGIRITTMGQFLP